MNQPIGQALDQVRRLIGNEVGFVDGLAADALLARVDQAGDERGQEFRAALPGLLELLVSNDLGSTRPWEVSRRISNHWADWPQPLQAAVAQLFDVWWATVLGRHPSEPPVADVLSTLVCLDLPLSRWLQPLLQSLDGPAARHLAEIVDGRLDTDGWHDHDDERRQILGWCRTEPVVMGLTLVGALHLDDGHLGLLLDELL